MRMSPSQSSGTVALTLRVLTLISLALPCSVAMANNALLLDGTDDYVAADGVCTGLNGPTAFSMECWVKPTAVDAGYYVLAFNDSDKSNNIQVGINASGQLSLMRDDTTVTGSTLSTGQWYHIAVTVAADNTTLVYLNGVQDITTATTERPATDGYFSIGQEWDVGGESNFATGQVDEVRIWDDVRSVEEIRANMYRRLQGNEANLVAYYKLDTGTGTTAVDSTAGGYDGTLVGTPTWVTSGAFEGPGRALDLDGANDYVVIGPNAALETPNFTVEFWIRLNGTTSTYAGVLDKGRETQTNWYFFTIQNNLGLMMGLGSGSGRSEMWFWLGDTEWHHVAGTFDGTTAKVYVDGVFQDSITYTMATSNTDLYIGRWRPSYTNYGYFAMDELRIWSTARTPAELRDTMCKTLVGDETGLVAYYRFDQQPTAGQTTVYDITSNEINGTLNNMDATSDWITSPAFNTWVGSTDDSWSTADNWSRNAAPVTTDNIGIPDYSDSGIYPNGNAPTITGNPTVKNFALSAGAEATLASDLTVSSNCLVNSALNIGVNTVNVSGTTVVTGTLGISTGEFNADGVFDASEGALTFTGAGTLVLSNDDTDLGTFTAGTSTITYDGTDPTIADASYYNLTIDCTGTADASAATGLVVQNQLAIDGGTFLTPGDLADVSIASGATLQLADDITVSGTWINAGTFTHNDHTVTLDGTNQFLAGDSTFHTLVKTVTAAATLTFEAGSTTIITNTFELGGADSNRLSLRSDTPGTQWNIDPPDMPGGTRTLAYLDIQDSVNADATELDVSAANCVSSGNNVNWWIATPTITTVSATNTGDTTATVTGNITDLGDPVPTQHGVCWGTTENPTIAGDKTEEGVPSGTGEFTGDLSGLTAGQLYYVRAYATNAIDTSYGTQRSLTAGTTLPTVTTTPATDMTDTTTTSGGNVTDDGGLTVTARGVCYNTTGTPTLADNKTTNGTGEGEFTSNLTGLTPSTRYYVRAYATNANGTSYGSQNDFTTDAAAEPNEPNEPAPEPNEPAPEPNEPVEPNEPAATTPDLHVSIAAGNQAALVGEEFDFTVAVQNLGTGGATGVELRIPLPTDTEFVGAWLSADEAAQSTPLDATVTDGVIVITLGDVAADETKSIDVVLRALASGTVTLEASIASAEQNAPATAQANSDVDVEDVYYQVVSTTTPVSVCGLFGFGSLFVLTLGLLAMKWRLPR